MRPLSAPFGRAVLLAALATGLTACGGDGRPEVWIYTSIYPSVIERMEPVFARALPEVRLRWYQKGSEQVAVKLSAELAAGETRCDLLVTSDPFYYAELKGQERLLPYASPAAEAVPDDLRDPDDTWVTVRVPLMVLGVNRDHVKEADRPRSFRDLAAKALKGRVSMGDPLKSGTNFTTVAALSASPGWGLLEAWCANGLVAAGGNSAVLQRLETGERPVGVILLENLLPRVAKGAPLDVVYPEDGAVPIPSPIAILASTDTPELSRRVYDLFFSDAVQDAIVAGWMYSPLPERPPPRGAAAWDDVVRVDWTPEQIDDVKGRREAIKQRFREIMRK